jgi:hypothetical protein
MSGAFQVQCFVRSPSSGVGWRLLSGNNRVVGRAAAAFVDEQACREAVDTLKSRMSELSHHIRRVPGNLWSWEARHHDVIVAVAGHPFDRMIRCEQSVTSFLVTFAEAPVQLAVLDSGSRRWRHQATRGDVA